MKRFCILLTVGWSLFSIFSQGAETAQARLYCLSLKFQQGTTFGGTLNLSSTGDSPYNGELMPYDQEWASYFFLSYGGYGTIPGIVYVNLPAPVDANNNRFDDFFEVSQASTASTFGSESTGISSGNVTATWSRTAGSPNGTCVLSFTDDTYGYLGSYTCPFTLIEYTGSLTYTPGSNTISATVNLTQTGHPANTFSGPIVFLKSPTDPLDILTNQPGVWTNAALQTLSFDNEVFTRGFPTWPTNYVGWVFFADGDPSTAASDYQLWVLSINDTNDVNANGIPDFSDNPAGVAPPRVPHLSIARGSTNLLLTISGSVGHTNQIQGISSLASTNWQVAQTFLQTNDPQVVSLLLPTGSPKYWRVVAW
jgi:hypothetical protein